MFINLHVDQGTKATWWVGIFLFPPPPSPELLLSRQAPHSLCKISITKGFKPLYPCSGQFNLSVPLYNTDHDQYRAGRPQPRPPLPHSRPSPPPPPPSSQRLAFLEITLKVFDPQNTIYIIVWFHCSDRQFHGWSMRWWPGSKSWSLIKRQKCSTSLFPLPQPTRTTGIIGPFCTWALLCTLSSPSLLYPSCPLPPKKGKLWAKRKVDMEELAFPAACSGVLKMLFFTKPFLPNAFLLKLCHFPFSFSPWKREVTYSPLVKI